MTSPLFTSVHVGGRLAPHRVVMAPMTRARSTQPGDVPNAMNARYYAQRASAALIVSEATQVSPQGKGYSFTPGIYPSSSEISLILRPLMPPLSLTRLKYAILALPNAL